MYRNPARLLVLLTLAGGVVAAPAAAAPDARAAAHVEVFFPRGDWGPSCTRVRARPRSVSAPGVLRGAVSALLRGPTRAERRRGYGGWFSRRTAGHLRSVALADGVARIDLRDFRRVIPNASTSCGSALLLAQLDRTALQFPSVRSAVYSFDGSVSRFYRWLQRPAPHAVRAAALTTGATGPAVRRLEERLRTLRFLRPGALDGVFDQETWHAVVAFQG